MIRGLRKNEREREKNKKSTPEIEAFYRFSIYKLSLFS